ncbi:hypothetical protein GCWU000325_00348 [Alloprevotella tannerae ATCC 51259]|uniref:Uncharacterized protein n=1 Tax=Alloprevotella tannerae ATCC 51259 TaxID=626522 RepID=C9LDS6_9BACT|nr:hypothetical protein GCWU000325_00348 [Alloprevotella tannerae ATCC 51259]
MHLHHNKLKSQQNKRKQSYKTTQKDNNTLQTMQTIKEKPL